MYRRTDPILRQRLTVWGESLVIVFGILGLGALSNPSDPFFLKTEFPWLWFGPLLVALRYGMAPALSSVGLLIATWLMASRFGTVSETFPTLQMAGGLLLTLVSAQFSTVWHQRLRRAQQISQHAGERFEQLSKAYFMVRQSHDRLEQNLISRPVTLRQAMLDLRQLLVQTGGLLQQDTASELLGILSHYCSLESAAIHAVQQGKLLQEPLAFCGRKSDAYVPNDQLLRAALESGNAAYQAANRLRQEERSAYLVAAPIRTSSGILLGMLLVTEMPFLALQRETLQIMAVLLAYTADHAEAAATARSILAIYPDCPTLFASELIKMVRLKRDLDIASSLVVISVKPTARMEDICMVLERQQRGLDHAWRRSVGWGVQFVTLMPFAGPGAAEGYLTRLNGILTKQYKLTARGAGITSHFALMTSEDPLLQLAELLREEF